VLRGLSMAAYCVDYWLVFQIDGREVSQFGGVISFDS
jgi:hypothetical protein